jgi:isopenicillin-N epimerase
MTLRNDFLLTRDWRLLNNGSFGACPIPVFETYQRWQRTFEQHPHVYMNKTHEMLAEARSALAAYLGTEKQNLGFVTNATMGVNVFAHSFRARLQPGDEVLSTNHEYRACDHAWQYVCEKTGATYISQSIDVPLTSEAQFVDALWSGVTPRTRVIYLSHTTSPTALTFPLSEICQRARAAGIYTVIDGAHVPGQRDLALDALGADFYTGNCHKWMCAPKGSGFVYARPEVQALIEPLIVGHYWFPGERSTQPLVDYVEQFGTRDLAAFLSVPAAIDYMAQHDWAAVRARSHALALETRATLQSAFATADIAPATFAWGSQLMPIRLPDNTDMDKLAAILRDHYKVEMPLITWRDVKLARLSVQCYTTQDELDVLVEALTTHVPACTLPATATHPMESSA